MKREHSIRRSRSWYARLLRLYPKPFRERFGEGMEQTFSDLLRERVEERGRDVFVFTLWMFVETFAGIVRENLRMIWMPNVTTCRLAAFVAITPAFLILWFYGAVAEEGDSPGPIFLAPVAVLIVGALMARLRPRGLMHALLATALAQALIAVIEMMAWGQYLELSLLNGCLIALWVGSAMLFRRASTADLQVERTA